MNHTVPASLVVLMAFMAWALLGVHEQEGFRQEDPDEPPVGHEAPADWPLVVLEECEVPREAVERFCMILGGAP